ncbi:hypothetical protein PO909_032816 [Leuciscus waleckii]
MSQQIKRCVPPCSRPISELDTHAYCFVCLGEEHAALALEQGECKHCELFTVKMLRARLSYFQTAPTLPSWGSRMDLADKQETGPSLSLALSPDPRAPLRDPCASSAHAGDDEKSLGSVDYEQPASERSSREDKSVEELLEDLHDELSKSWSKPYTSLCLCALDVNFFEYRGCEVAGVFRRCLGLKRHSRAHLRLRNLPSPRSHVEQHQHSWVKLIKLQVRLVLRCTLWQLQG